MDKKERVALLNFHVSIYNYGALMVAYSLSRKVRELGYNPVNINFIRPAVVSKKDAEPFASFRKKYIPLTEECYTYEDLLQLNDKLNKIVVGSDQVWCRQKTINGGLEEYIFFLDWADGEKSLISYAACFGKGRFQRKKSEILAIRKLLKRFDALSVREQSGLEACRNILNIETEQTIDPTLLFDAREYEKIIDDEGETDEFDGDYLGFMFVDDDNCEKLRNSPVASEIPLIPSLKDSGGNYRPFGHWLNCIRNAKYMVTDSFHGTCFSLIFGKQVIFINNSYSGNDRIVNLLTNLGINPDRFIDSLDEITLDSFSDRIDYERTYEQLEKLRRKSVTFLEKSLALPPRPKKEFRFSLPFYGAKILEKIGMT